MRTKIKVETNIKATPDKVWMVWTSPEHITKWNSASSDWHTINAENDLKIGGRFLSRMEAKDGSMGFDFSGTYEKIKEHSLIEYILDDGRKVSIEFSQIINGETSIVETFEAEDSNPIEMQKDGWQAILNNFKRVAESLEE